MEDLGLNYTWNSNMTASAVILVLTFAFIFTEGLHKLHRTKVALAGGIVMILVGQTLGFYDQREAVAAIDWNVIFLLGAMMSIVAIMIPTGGFEWLAYIIANWTKGRPFILLATLGTAVTVISLILDNVTTVIIFGPLTIFICRALAVNPVPYLLAEALLSDTGGIATLVGDPPNIIIGSAANIDFNTFFIHMGGIVFVCWVVILLFQKFMFRKELAIKPEVAQFNVEKIIKNYITLRWSLISLGIVIILFTQHKRFDLEPGLVAMIGLGFIFVFAREVDIEASLKETELPILLFFISLFVVIGGVEHSHLLSWLGQFIVPFAQKDPLLACILLLWVAGILSAAMDNIPFTVAMVPVIKSMHAYGINVTPFWWCLALGVGLGGNGTHIGSTANIYIVTISERIAKEVNRPDYRITPGLWIKKGTPAMILTLTVATGIIVIFFKFFAS